MDWNSNPYSIVLFFGAALGLALMIASWQRRHSPGGDLLAGVMLCVTIWAAGYAFELGFPTIEGKTTAAQVEYLGIVGVILFWFFFMLAYTGHSNWLSFRNVFLFSIEPVLVILLVWTNSSHHWFWRTVVLDASEELTVFRATYGYGFFMHTAYSYILLVASTILLMRQLIRSSGVRRQQMLVILPGALAPWIGNVAYVLFSLPVDLTPFGFLITGLTVIWSLYRFQLLEISPAARQLVFENIPSSVIIIGSDGVILDANPATEKMFGFKRSELLGKSSAQLWCWEEDPEILYQAMHLELDNSGAWTNETRFVRKNGATGVAQVTVAPLLDKNGWRIASIGVSHDITERVGNERLLRFEPTEDK